MTDFEELYKKQMEFQKVLLDKGSYDFLFVSQLRPELPCDITKLFSYHIQQLVSEIGEVLSSDKRWKTHRSKTTPEMLIHKKEELADCFIVLMNLCIFSGMSADEMLKQIESKIDTNIQRVSK